MLESLLRVANFYWAEDSFRPEPDLDGASSLGASLANLRGQFSLARTTERGTLVLIRDCLGANKLFLAIHESGKVVVANYLIDLVNGGVPFEAIYSVPPGHFLELEVRRRGLSVRRYFEIKTGEGAAGTSLEEIARTIRAHLEICFARLSEHFRGRKVCVCLSGGLDSSVIAAFATKHCSDVTAYTYGYVESGQSQSEDVRYAQKVADFLRIPLRFVPASYEDLIEVVENAICYGQDWRDFNVHCAVVNEILAKAIERDTEKFGYSKAPLAVTGDLMNEFLADYTSVSYAGREYYRLPTMDAEELRWVLVRGLDAGDREVGIFHHHGIDLVQPYGILMDQYLRLPSGFIAGERAKADLVRKVAGDLLPGFIFDRAKVRAQVGNPGQPVGVLPAVVRAGYDSAWLRRTFSRLFKIKDERFLNRFIRVGRYRFLDKFPDGRCKINGYFAG